MTAMPDAAAMIAVRGLGKRYANKSVLDDVSLSVARGEYHALIGANGAGKTTLIRALLDLAGYQHGTLTINGIASTRAAARQSLAYLPERFVPSSFLKGREYLAFSCRLHRQRWDAALIEDYCARFGFPYAALEKTVASYSKGMAQKLGLIGCFSSGATLLILDEPMSGLDPVARHQLRQALAHARASGVTVLLSSHLLADVEELCDAVTILHHGQVLFQGTPQACCQAWDCFTLEQAYIRCLEAHDGRDSAVS